MRATTTSLNTRLSHCDSIAEVYLEPSEAFKMELFYGNTQRNLVVNYFGKKLPSKMFDWVINTYLNINI